MFRSCEDWKWRGVRNSSSTAHHSWLPLWLNKSCQFNTELYISVVLGAEACPGFRTGSVLHFYPCWGTKRSCNTPLAQLPHVQKLLVRKEKLQGWKRRVWTGSSPWAASQLGWYEAKTYRKVSIFQLLKSLIFPRQQSKYALYLGEKLPHWISSICAEFKLFCV